MLEENPLLPQDRALPEDVRLLVNDDNAGVVVTAADIKTVLERLGPWGYGLEKTKRALPLEEVYRDGREDQVLPQDNHFCFQSTSLAYSAHAFAGFNPSGQSWRGWPLQPAGLRAPTFSNSLPPLASRPEDWAQTRLWARPFMMTAPSLPDVSSGHSSVSGG